MKTRKVLVVDDSKLLHRMFEMMLRGFPLVHAFDGREALDRAAELAREIEARPPAAGDLSARLADVESDRDELSTKLAEYEQQVGRLMNLYVATYQLHATLDPSEVQATIAEIAINLLGAEQFVLLFWKNDARDSSGECEIAFAQGMEDDQTGLYPNGIYGGR